MYLVIYALEEGTMRFGQLLKRIDGISTKMLTQTLRAMEAQWTGPAGGLSSRSTSCRVLSDAPGRNPERAHAGPQGLGLRACAGSSAGASGV
jgi:hypothetical protein